MMVIPVFPGAGIQVYLTRNAVVASATVEKIENGLVHVKMSDHRYGYFSFRQSPDWKYWHQVDEGKIFPEVDKIFRETQISEKW